MTSLEQAKRDVKQEFRDIFIASEFLCHINADKEKVTGRRIDKSNHAQSPDFAIESAENGKVVGYIVVKEFDLTLERVLKKGGFVPVGMDVYRLLRDLHELGYPSYFVAMFGGGEIRYLRITGDQFTGIQSGAEYAWVDLKHFHEVPASCKQHTL